MTVVEPSPSTANIFLTKAFFFAKSFIPKDRVTVMVRGKASGTTATATAIVTVIISALSTPAKNPMAKRTMDTNIAKYPTFFARSLVFLCKGVSTVSS